LLPWPDTLQTIAFIAMKRRTKSGCLITYAEFWLDWRTYQGEKFPVVSCHRSNHKSQPLNRTEAMDYWGRRCFGVEFTEDARDFMLTLLDLA